MISRSSTSMGSWRTARFNATWTVRPGLDLQGTVFYRSPFNIAGGQIVIHDPTVSRFHAQIRLRFGEHFIFNAHMPRRLYVQPITFPRLYQ